MPHAYLTPEDLTALCRRAFPDRDNQQLEAVMPMDSRQHEVVAFQLRWDDSDSPHSQPLIARRYVSTISWWRPDDGGKAQREVTVSRWLHEQDFPAPQAYAREIGVLGDVALFDLLRGHDWTVYGGKFRDVIRPMVAEFARLLAWLHSLTPPEDVRQVVPQVTLPTALASLTALAHQVEQRELIDAAEQVMVHAFNVQEGSPVLLHGDYHFSNALLHDGKIVGIVDWEYAAYGDPRWDVANAYMQLVDFDAADSAEMFLENYLYHSGRDFEGPPVYNVVAPLQQWAISEWLVRKKEEGEEQGFGLAEELIALRNVHRRRAELALRLLDI